MERIRKYLKVVICMAVLIAMGIAGVAGTYAWNTHQAAQENNLQSKNISIETLENFPDRTVTPGATKTKEVAFKNFGTGTVFLRVAFKESWETTDTLKKGSTDVTKNWTTAWTNDWELKSDGWYYYKKVLPAGGTTDKILNGVTFPQIVENGASYDLSFLTETVQVSDEDAVNTSATTTVFGRAAIVTGKTITNGTVTSGTVTWS